MTRLRTMCGLVVMWVGCTSPSGVEIDPDEMSAKADGMASKLRLEDDHRVDVEEPSDLAFADGKLYTVSDRVSRIYEIDDDGDLKDDFNVEATDLEALAVDGDGHFYIADESRARVWRVNSSGERKESFDIDVSDGNSGIEGLAFDGKGRLLVAQEEPATIIVVEDGQEVDRVELDFADDLSALAYNPDDDHLYAISDQEHKLFRLDSDFDKITSWKLPVGNPEGLAFDGNTVYIASDADARLYVFTLD